MVDEVNVNLKEVNVQVMNAEDRIKWKSMKKVPERGRLKGKTNEVGKARKCEQADPAVIRDKCLENSLISQSQSSETLLLYLKIPNLCGSVTVSSKSPENRNVPKVSAIYLLVIIFTVL